MTKKMTYLEAIEVDEKATRLIAELREVGIAAAWCDALEKMLDDFRGTDRYVDACAEVRDSIDRMYKMWEVA